VYIYIYIYLKYNKYITVNTVYFIRHFRKVSLYCDLKENQTKIVFIGDFYKKQNNLLTVRLHSMIIGHNNMVSKIVYE